MKDRKQEIIEILKKYVQPDRSEDFILRDATAIYDSIAPLMKGEFPEEEIDDAFCEYGHEVANAPHAKAIQLPSYKKYVLQLERLWEGQEAKGICSKCGGYGRGGDMSMPHPEDNIICSQCDGTGEERRKQVPFRHFLLEKKPGQWYYLLFGNSDLALYDHRTLKDRCK